PVERRGRRPFQREVPVDDVVPVAGSLDQEGPSGGSGGDLGLEVLGRAVHGGRGGGYGSDQRCRQRENDRNGTPGGQPEPSGLGYDDRTQDISLHRPPQFLRRSAG